jgi:hypothetical protein
MVEAGIIMRAGVAVAVFGMALIVLGVISGGLFYPGLFVLTAGLVGVAVAGMLYVIRPARQTGSEQRAEKH